jgi:hypothetical protein
MVIVNLVLICGVWFSLLWVTGFFLKRRSIAVVEVKGDTTLVPASGTGD